MDSPIPDLSKYNPLKEFRTYSYYHVLMVTNTSDFVTYINSTSTDVDFYLHSDLKGSGKIGDRYTAQTVSGKENLKYVILANTSTDANIIINDVTINNLIGGSALGPNPFAPSDIFMNELKMSITEPFGNRFVENFLRACSSLNINQGQSILLLKTIFVGHRSDGEIEIITKYNALPFMIIDLSFSFSHSGTTYQLNGVSVDNGFASLPINSTVRNLSSVGTKTGLFKDFVEEFTRLLNTNRNEDMTSSGKNLPVRTVQIAPAETDPALLAIAPGLAKPYTDPVYKIAIADSSKSNNPDGGTVAFSSLNSIPDVLLHVSGICEAMNTEAKAVFKEDDLFTVVYTPRITTQVVQKADSSGKVTTTFIYTVTKRYQTVFKNDAALKKYKELQSSSSTMTPAEKEKDIEDKRIAFYEKQKAANNLMEYDYIFSGKNEDLIHMNMVFDFGVGALYNEVTPQQPTNIAAQTSVATLTKGAASGTNQVTNTSNQNAPIPHTLTAPLVNPDSYKDFQRLLRRYAYFETLTAEIEILGNPRFVAKSVTPGAKSSTSAITPTTSGLAGLYDPASLKASKIPDAVYDQKTNKVTTSNPSTKSSAELQDTIGFQYSTTAPFFVKVNVFMPMVNAITGMVEFTSENYLTDSEKGFRHPFWYDGLFTVQEITSSFENGKFTQKLTLLQIVTDGSTIQNYTVQGAEADKAADGKSSGAGGAGSVVDQTLKKKTKQVVIVRPGTDVAAAGGSNNLVAFLRTIRVCEGTIPSSHDSGYKQIVGGFPVPMDDPQFANSYSHNKRAIESKNVVLNGPYSSSTSISDLSFNFYTAHPAFYVTMYSPVKQGFVDKETGKQYQAFPLIQEGKLSSAAGAYQIVKKTWDNGGGGKGEFPDFSPANQDKFAIKLLENRGLLDLVKKGYIVEVLEDVGLGQEWASFKVIKDSNVLEIYKANGGTVNGKGQVSK